MQHDGYVVGRTYLGVRYEKVPERTSEELQVDFVPICAPDCRPLEDQAASGDGSLEDPLSLAPSDPSDPSALVAGEPKSTTITVVSEEDASSGGGPIEVCSDWAAYCGTCGSLRACSSNASGACEAWYETTSGVTRHCNACDDCTGAANAIFYDCGCDQT